MKVFQYFSFFKHCFPEMYIKHIFFFKYTTTRGHRPIEIDHGLVKPQFTIIPAALFPLIKANFRGEWMRSISLQPVFYAMKGGVIDFDLEKEPLTSKFGSSSK